MRHTIQVLALLVTSLLFGCSKEDMDSINSDPIEFIYDFNSGQMGWTADYTDYFINMEDDIDFKSELISLPEPLDTSEAAIMIGGTNVSDDLFMFLKKNLTGLESNTIYNFEFEVTFATDVPDGTVGIGGSPGESVFIKGGAVNIEPMKIQMDDEYLVNIDKGNQSTDGPDIATLGDFSNDTNEEIFVLKTVGNEEPFRAMTDENGTIWIIIGSESGFEGRTQLIFDRLKIVARK